MSDPNDPGGSGKSVDAGVPMTVPDSVPDTLEELFRRAWQAVATGQVLTEAFYERTSLEKKFGAQKIQFGLSPRSERYVDLEQFTAISTPHDQAALKYAQIILVWGANEQGVAAGYGVFRLSSLGNSLTLQALQTVCSGRLRYAPRPELQRPGRIFKPVTAPHGNQRWGLTGVTGQVHHTLNVEFWEDGTVRIASFQRELKYGG